MMKRLVAISTVAIWLMPMANAYDMVPRWGHATTYISEPPSLLISGGKTPISSSDSQYASSLNSPDLIILPLSSSFNVDAAPFEKLDKAGPAYAWHTLSAYNGGLLSSGGDGGASTPLPAGADSTWLSVDNTTFTQEPTSWGQQPARMIYHSAVSKDGKVYITGGQRNDGSGRILADVYVFDGNTFSTLPPLPIGTAHHASAIIANGTLVVLGGISVSANTGNAALSPLDTVYALDEGGQEWRIIKTLGDAPSPRRGAGSFAHSGDRLVLIGGSDVGRTAAMDDMWSVELGNVPAWRKIEAAPGGRFDFSATPIGDGKVAMIGGYGASGPVPATLQLYDVATNTWQTSFDAPATTGPTESSGSAQNPPSTGVVGSPSSTGPSSLSPPLSASPGQPSPGDDSDPPGSTNRPSSSAEPAASNGLSKSAQIGLAVGIISGLSLVALCLFLCVRRRRRHAYAAAGKGEKEQGALPSEWSEKGGIVGLGLGAISAGWTKVSPQRRRDPYQTIQDDNLYSPPARKPTKRTGGLIGPRPPPGPRAPLSPPRVDMLHDEDSRNFKDEDWTVDRNSRDQWRTARSIRSLVSEDEEDDAESLLPGPRILGGPVPTPTVRSLVDPFADTASIHPDTASIRSTGSDQSLRPGMHQLPSSASMDFTDLLAVPNNRHSYAQSSAPRSERSRGSTHLSASDIEEGIVHEASRRTARYASPLIISPDPNEGQPIKRSESFFKRMTAGGIVGLLGGQGVVNAKGRKLSLKELDIRDEGDAPGIWPVSSRATNGPASSSNASPASYAPPSAWANRSTGGPDRSVSSLATARSMRGMVVVQREGNGSDRSAGEGYEGDVLDLFLSPRAEETDKRAYPNDVALTSAPIPTFKPTQSDLDMAEAVQEEIVFASPPKIELVDYTSPPPPPHDEPVSASALAATHSSAIVPTVPLMLDTPSPPRHDSRDELIDYTPKSQTRSPSPPNGSPLPKGVLAHRRPVKDMVFSINKRSSQHFGNGLEPNRTGGTSPTKGGGLSPSMLLSPMGQYSNSPGATPWLGRDEGGSVELDKEKAKTTWEVRRSESLVVANPDRK